MMNLLSFRSRFRLRLEVFAGPLLFSFVCLTRLSHTLYIFAFTKIVFCSLFSLANFATQLQIIHEVLLALLRLPDPFSSRYSAR